MAKKPTSDYIKLERSRNARLWVGQIASIAMGVAVILETHPELKEKAKEKLISIKNRFKKKPEVVVIHTDELR